MTRLQRVMAVGLPDSQKSPPPQRWQRNSVARDLKVLSDSFLPVPGPSKCPKTFAQLSKRRRVEYLLLMY
jgi:hypothetical protein